MERDRKELFLFLLPELGCMLLAALGIYYLSHADLLRQDTDRMLCYLVLEVLGIGIVGVLMRENMIRGELDYENGRFVWRFWLCFLGGLVVAFACAFLPAAAWPFLPVFVLLTLFSNLNTGVLSGAVLLAVPVFLAGNGTEVFLLYLVSGMFGAVLFQKLHGGFKTGLPSALAIACLLVCLTAGTVLTANARLSAEQFLVPFANLIISGILLAGILKCFFAGTIYRYRDRYLDLNDTESEILAALRQEDKETYLRNIHTAYFCERIAGRLSFDADALKCAAYYHGVADKLPELMQKTEFPPAAARILEDYENSRREVRYKETAVLLAADHIVSAVRDAQSRQEGNVDYDPVIGGVFARFEKAGTWKQCDMTMREFQTMLKIFREEKLYYDFLR